MAKKKNKIRVHTYQPQAAVVKITPNKSGEGVIKFGKDNNFPNLIIDLIDDSGTGSNCLDKTAAFVEAEGFANTELGKTVCNEKGDTYDTVLSMCANNTAYFDCPPLKVTYSEDGEKTFIEYVPFEKLRKRTGGGFVYNENFGTKDYKAAEDLEMPEFTYVGSSIHKKALVDAQVDFYGSQRGWIVYEFNMRPGKTIYPVPIWYSDIEDVQSDAALQKLEMRNIKGGFRPNVIISLVGMLDDETKDENGETQRSAFEKSIDSFTGEEASSIMVLESLQKEGLAQVNVFPLADLLDGVDRARPRVARFVCQIFGVPPAIIGMNDSDGFGNSQALLNKIELFKMMIRKKQNLIKRSFQKVFPGVDFTISDLNIIKFIPPEILAKLTDDEIRDLAGYKPLANGSTDEKLLSEILGVGGTQALVSILTDPLLTDGQKVATIMELFGRTREVAEDLVYGRTQDV